MSSSPFVSWPSDPGGHAPAPGGPPPGSYGPAPQPYREPLPVGRILLACVAAPVGLVLIGLVVVVGFMASPILVAAVPAGAVVLAVCRARPGNTRNRPARPAPAPQRLTTSKTSPPLITYQPKG